MVIVIKEFPAFTFEAQIWVSVFLHISDNSPEIWFGIVPQIRMLEELNLDPLILNDQAKIVIRIRMLCLTGTKTGSSNLK
jgi:hypothetical protein